MKKNPDRLNLELCKNMLNPNHVMAKIFGKGMFSLFDGVQYIVLEWYTRKLDKALKARQAQDTTDDEKRPLLS